MVFHFDSVLILNDRGEWCIHIADLNWFAIEA
jgi:hypothetical protein